VLDDVNTSQTTAWAQVAVSSQGTLAYVPESLGDPLRELVWLDRSGHATEAASARQRFLTVSLSPDDLQAGVTILGGSRDLWTYSFKRGTLSRLTSGEGTEFNPVWSHDGRELFYIVDRPPFVLHRIPIGTPDSGRSLWDEQVEVDTIQPAVSPDGRTIAFVRVEDQTGCNLYSRPIDGNEPPRAIRATRSEETYPSFSPDGRWIAYQSNETGRSEIYVEPFPGPGDRVQVSADGGTEPVWARNGEIFFRHDDDMRVAATRRGGRFEFDPPRTLFSFPIVPAGGHEVQTYGVTADGTRVLAITIREVDRPRQIEVVTNWMNQLPTLALGGKR
jgi:hypothetical protein